MGEQMGEAGKPEKKQLHYLDGLRGVASLLVVVFHFLQTFLPAIVLGLAPGRLGASVSHWILGNPLSSLISGSFAVSIFFLMSGYVLSLPYCRSRDPKVPISGMLRRYFRLAIPILLSNLFLLALMYCDVLNFKNLENVVQVTGTYRGRILDLPIPGFFEMVRESLWNTLITGKFQKYNPVLWSMQIEFIGSFLVYGLLLTIGRQRWRWAVYLAFVLLCHWRYPTYLSFLSGLILCELHTAGILGLLQSGFRKNLTVILLLIIAFYFGGLPSLTPPEYLSTTPWYAWVANIQWMPRGNVRWLILNYGSLSLLSAILLSSRLQDLLGGVIGRFLGKISFGLYLTHLPVMFAIQAPVFLALLQLLESESAAVVSFLVCLPVYLSIGWLSYHWLDQPAIAIGKLFYDKLMVASKRITNR